MTTNGPFSITVEDVEYLRHGDKLLLTRIFRPRGDGPFPLIVDLHGGAWCVSTRESDVVINEALAKSGAVVAALDFRMPPDASYPGSMADINYAIRWLKTRATSLGSRPDLVGVLGVSSGAHQGMLGAMRPADPRYAAIPLPQRWMRPSAASSSAGPSSIRWDASTTRRSSRPAGPPTPTWSTGSCPITIRTGAPRPPWPRAIR